MKPKLLVAVDFDGTIVKHDYPQIGEPLPEAFEVLREMQEYGHELILWTCREDQSLRNAIAHCEERGIRFVSHNSNLDRHNFKRSITRKILADVYIDDRNFGGFPGWQEVRMRLVGETDIGRYCRARNIDMREGEEGDRRWYELNLPTGERVIQIDRKATLRQLVMVLRTLFEDFTATEFGEDDDDFWFAATDDPNVLWRFCAGYLGDMEACKK